jgi:opacity protein-like surface antigen
MHRKTPMLAAALAVTVFVHPAQAAKGNWFVDFTGGTALPIGDFKDDAKLGFMGGVGVGYRVSDRVSIGADGSFVVNDGSDDLDARLTEEATTLEGTPTTVTGKWSMLQGGAHLKFMLPSGEDGRIDPYGVVGLGVYNVKAKTESANATYEDEASVNKFGGRGGLGFAYKASGSVGIGLEGTFHFIATEGASTRFFGVQALVSVGLSQPE